MADFGPMEIIILIYLLAVIGGACYGAHRLILWMMNRKS
jgi:hypothetical protein